MTDRLRRNFLRSLAAGSTGALAGCTSLFGSETAAVSVPDDGWPLPGRDSHNTGFNPNATPPTTDPTVDWRATGGTGSAWAPRPAVVDNTLYLGGTQLTAHSLEDGSVVWETDADNPVCGVSADAETLYCLRCNGVHNSDETTEIYAYDRASGNHRWTASGDWGFIRGPVVHDGTVFVPKKDGLIALNQSDGTKKWESTTNNPSPVRPAVTDDGLYHLRNGNLAKYSRGPQDRIWTENFPWAVRAAPAMAGDSIFIGKSINLYTEEDDNDAQVAAFGTDGTEQWSATIGSVCSSPSIANGTVYVLTGVFQEKINRGSYREHLRDAVIRVFDASDGTERWQRTYPGFGNWMTEPVVADGVCYAALHDGIEERQQLVAIRDGDELWSMNPPAPAHHLAVVGDALIVSLSDGSVLVLR